MTPKFLHKLLNGKDQKSIVDLFTLFTVVTVFLFMSLTLMILVPSINRTLNSLQLKADESAVRAYANQVRRYVYDRELALQDIAANALVTNAVLIADGQRPDFRDYIKHVKLLGLDPHITVVDVNGDVLFTELAAEQSFKWVLPLIEGDKQQILNLNNPSESVKFLNSNFVLAIPVYYGRGREGAIVAEFVSQPRTLFEKGVHREDNTGVTLTKNGVTISTDTAHISLPHQQTEIINDYDLELTLTTSRTDILAKKRSIIWSFIFSVWAGALVILTLLFLLGRKIIVRPFVQLARTQEAISKAVEGISQIDPDGHYVTLNAAYAGAAGYTPEELVGKPWTVTVYPDDLPLLNDAYQTMLDDGQVTAEARGIKKDGSIFYKQVTMVSQYNKSGVFFGHHCFLKDITQRKKAEREREKLVEKLLESNEELERFAFVCSHDLQEPLRMIGSFSEKLKEHMGDKLKGDVKGERYFNFVTDGATRAQSLISDILTYSSLSNDAQNLEEVSLNQLVDRIRHSVISDSDMESNCQITFDELPSVTGNKTQLFQLFQNLINNGLKYQDQRRQPEVHISVVEDNGYWNFAVRDNGIGMEDRHLSQIFEVFKRLHRRSEFAGTGVGLSICKKVVERHGGKIWVESEIGQGSTFHFTILKSNTQEMTYEDQRKAS